MVRVGLITSRKKSLHHGVIYDSGPSWIAIAALVVVTLHGRFNFNAGKLLNHGAVRGYCNGRPR